MTRKILNVAVDAVASVHLAVAVVAMYNAPIPSHVMAIDTAFGGKFKYLTFWNVCIETLYFWFCLVENVASSCTDNNNKPLRKVRDYWFTAIVFPLSSFVSVTFWLLMAVDRELVMPASVDPYFPSWLNHSVHTCILVYSLLELVTTYHKTGDAFPKHCCGLWFLTVTYLAWCIIVWTQCDMWVYPILKVLNWPGRIAFFSASLLANTVFLYLGFYINKLVWKEKLHQE